jgi:hypothetical protein
MTQAYFAPRLSIIQLCPSLVTLLFFDPCHDLLYGPGLWRSSFHPWTPWATFNEAHVISNSLLQTLFLLLLRHIPS